MKVNIIKPHSAYKVGEHDLSDARANYLKRTGHAVDASSKKTVTHVTSKAELETQKKVEKANPDVKPGTELKTKGRPKTKK